MMVSLWVQSSTASLTAMPKDEWTAMKMALQSERRSV